MRACAVCAPTLLFCPCELDVPLGRVLFACYRVPLRVRESYRSLVFCSTGSAPPSGGCLTWFVRLFCAFSVVDFGKEAAPHAWPTRSKQLVFASE